METDTLSFAGRYLRLLCIRAEHAARERWRRAAVGSGGCARGMYGRTDGWTRVVYNGGTGPGLLDVAMGVEGEFCWRFAVSSSGHDRRQRRFGCWRAKTERGGLFYMLSPRIFALTPREPSKPRVYVRRRDNKFEILCSVNFVFVAGLCWHNRKIHKYLLTYYVELFSKL